MPRRTPRRPLCGEALPGGGKCRNYADTCPHRPHSRRAAAGASLPTASRPPRVVPPALAAAAWPDPVLSDWFGQAAAHLGLDERQIIHDYWLVRGLYEVSKMIGPSGVLQNPYTQTRVGQLVLGGGTSLSAAWDIAPRYSEDIDLILIPYPDVAARRVKHSIKAFARDLARRMNAPLLVDSRGPRHCFFRLPVAGGDDISVDVTVKAISSSRPILILPEPVGSLTARTAPEELLARHPELGRPRGPDNRGALGPSFRVPVLGPCSTAMDKLLAQTNLSLNGTSSQIKARARDIYDLACIARSAELFEGHIGRDSARLLHIAQQARLNADAAIRPVDGFATLASFTPGTWQWEALRGGYQTVADELVWGDRIDFERAITLAVSLDPGPAQGPPTDPPPEILGVAWPEREH